MKIKRNKTLGHDENPMDASSKSLDHNFKMVWMLIGFCILIIAIGFVLSSVLTAIWAIIIAALIVFILKTPVKWLQGKGVPRALSTAVFILLLLAAIVAAIVSLFPPIIDQGAQLLQAIPGYVTQIQQWWRGVLEDNPALASNPIISSWDSQASDAINSITQTLEHNLVSGVFSASMSIANVLFVGFTSFLVAFWILVDYDKMTKEAHAVAGRTSEWYMILFSTIFSRVIGGYIKGTLIGALITAVVSGIGYWAFGLPFSGVLGMLSGILSIIPYLGPVISTVVIAILAVFSGPIALVGSVAVSILVPWTVSTFISPKIMSSTVNLHPGISMLAIIGGSAIGGITGMVIAIPIVAIAKCIFVYFFEAITGRQLVSKNGALFDGAPKETIDPVADATDNFLDEETLFRMVERNESEVNKIEDMPRQNLFTLFHDLARPVSERVSEQAGDADDADARQ